MNTLIYLVFDHICNFAERFPAQIEYREEVEVLMFRILLRPILHNLSDNDEEEKGSSSIKNEASSEKPKQKLYKSSSYPIESSIRKSSSHF
jgi:hypothetical protein